MTTKPRLLTKTRFKLGCECETKLYYAGKESEYVNSSSDDPFMLGLAEGGFQVGELARIQLCDNPESDRIDEQLANKEILDETQRRMKNENATIAEAAFVHDNLFVRADVIKKVGKTIELYEVKSKSWSPGDNFWQKEDTTKPVSKWNPYLLDVAFQKYVVSKACPGMNVKAFLVLVNKDSGATVDGLNQLFKIAKRNGRTEVRAAKVTKQQTGANILEYVNVDTDIGKIWNMRFPVTAGGKDQSFTQLVKSLASIYAAGQRVLNSVGSKCKKCEYTYSSNPTKRRTQIEKCLKNGRQECWKTVIGRQYDPQKATVLEVWNYDNVDKNIQEGRYYIECLTNNDFKKGKVAARQLLQVEKIQKHDDTPWIDHDNLSDEIRKWQFPLHFIDFETSRVAVPFNVGRRPYEQIAFQFSHHTFSMDGQIKHAGQWLEPCPGKFPNFDFIRVLKKNLQDDSGTILCYAPHENTVLNDIYDQLMASHEPDRNDLCDWISTITSRRISNKEIVKGERCMVDMWKLVKEYHYDPYTHGSNSLKKVLPAIIHSSKWLRNKYGRPVYGTTEMPSLNYCKHIWIRPELDNDPYRALPPLFTDEQENAISEYLENFKGIEQGGEAMTAYAKLQAG